MAQRVLRDLGRLAEQLAHVVLRHPGHDLRDVRRRQRLRDRHEPAVGPEIEHVGARAVRAARIFEPLRAVVALPDHFRLARLAEHVLGRRHARLQIAERHRIGLDRIHRVSHFLVVAPGCQHGDRTGGQHGQKLFSHFIHTCIHRAGPASRAA
ncbi:hypothetical protein GPU89_15755 [Burkholderia cepacia]|nr:hypothetical protein [Burkholderia cepacia]